MRVAYVPLALLVSMLLPSDFYQTMGAGAIAMLSD